MRPPVVKLLVAAIAAVLLAMGLPSAAHAENGIGIGGSLIPGLSSAEVYQCPETFCNLGDDYFAGNDIAAICTANVDSGSWYFSLDHANNVSGFIPDYLMQVNGTPPPCPRTASEVAVQDLTVYQCPETFCNRGTFYRGNEYALFCLVIDDSGQWTLGLDTNDNVEGFIPNDVGASTFC